jgi:ubiquinone/menaquinone biosynthesis C-methylase UbiE
MRLGDTEVGRMWDDNADAWTLLSRAGYNVYRDELLTPAFLAMLPDVDGLRGLDIGCGEGHNTRLVSKRRARMIGIDIAPKFVSHARAKESEEPLGVSYVAGTGSRLPFGCGSFDFAVAFMSLMDMADQDNAVREARRVLRPGGFPQFSIIHPCFNTPRLSWIHDESGERVAVACGDYFADQRGRVDEWLFGAAPADVKAKLREFRVPRFMRTLSSWMNLLIDAGFTLERVEEPCADEETARRCPDVADTRIVAYFLHVRCRKRQ